MSDETRETVGKLSSDLIKESHHYDHTANEQMREQLKDYDKNIDTCLERSKKEFEGDFYIVVLTKKERLMQNVIRNYFAGRKSCPTPEYDQVVYRYNKKGNHLEFLWVVPAKDICTLMIQNALNLPSEQRMLLEFVMDFVDGTLFKKAKKLNGEKIDSPLLDKN
jgi:hypothetical protein